MLKAYVKATTWLHSEEGSTGVEYAILVGVIALVVLAGAQALAPKINSAFSTAAAGLP